MTSLSNDDMTATSDAAVKFSVKFFIALNRFLALYTSILLSFHDVNSFR